LYCIIIKLVQHHYNLALMDSVGGFIKALTGASCVY